MTRSRIADDILRAAVTSYGKADILRELEYDLLFVDIDKDRLPNGVRR